MTSGDLIYFSNKSVNAPADAMYRVQKVRNRQELVQAIMASANQPVFAPLVRMENIQRNKIEQFGDGGIRSYLPIDACIDGGATEIDVIVNSPLFIPETETYSKVFTIMMRGFALVTDAVGDDNLRLAQIKLKNAPSVAGAQKRMRIFRPPLGGYGTSHNEPFPFLASNLTFDATNMAKLCVKGYELGKRALTTGVAMGDTSYEEFRA
jgi:predicted acylesterase/phospholipase RssA